MYWSLWTFFFSSLLPILKWFTCLSGHVCSCVVSREGRPRTSHCGRDHEGLLWTTESDGTSTVVTLVGLWCCKYSVCQMSVFCSAEVRPLITDDTSLPGWFYNCCTCNCCVNVKSDQSSKGTASCLVLQLECVGRWTAIHAEGSTWRSACCIVVMWCPKMWTRPSPWLRRRNQFSLLNGAQQVSRQAVWCWFVCVNTYISECEREYYCICW